MERHKDTRLMLAGVLVVTLILGYFGITLPGFDMPEIPEAQDLAPITARVDSLTANFGDMRGEMKMLQEDFDAVALGDELDATSFGVGPGGSKTTFSWIVASKETIKNDAEVWGNFYTDIVDEYTSAAGVTVDGLTIKDGGIGESFTVAGTITGTGLVSTGSVVVAANVENFGIPSVISVTVPYTPVTGTVATVADGEIWFVHKVFVQTTTNFDCTGDNCTLTIGDGNDANGFLSAADANLQAAFTEATGYAAGWYGLENGSGGAYTLDDGGPFVYATSGAAETIDFAVGGTSPAAGSANVYIIYTRVK